MLHIVDHDVTIFVDNILLLTFSLFSPSNSSKYQIFCFVLFCFTENETELSLFKMEDYLQYKKSKIVKWWQLKIISHICDVVYIS